MSNNTRPIFRFQNLGPVKDAELELGDLTIIAGRNNTGKTYIAYALYGFLDQWPTGVFLSSLAEENTIMAKLFVVGGRSRALHLPTDLEKLQRLRKALIDQITRDHSNYILRNALKAEAETLEDAALSVQLGYPPNLAGIKVENYKDTELSFKHEDGALVISLKDTVPRNEGGAMNLMTTCLSFLFPEFSLNPIALSSERFGIALFHREIDLMQKARMWKLETRNQKNRKKRHPSILVKAKSSRYASPIWNNVHSTRGIPDMTKKRSALYERKPHDDIKRMMQGYYKVVNGGVRLVSTARKDGRFDIPLHQASSSARGLSDMYFYLRHAARKNHLLIIDEPETHLDTANQVEMARLLARLARSGVKVLITTHSDYIVKEINNLIMLSRSFKNKEAVVKELKYSDDDYLEEDQVRAYVAEKNGLTRCEMDEYGIEYPVFDETIHDINHRARKLSVHIWDDQDK